MPWSTPDEVDGAHDRYLRRVVRASTAYRQLSVVQQSGDRIAHCPCAPRVGIARDRDDDTIGCPCGCRGPSPRGASIIGAYAPDAGPLARGSNFGVSLRISGCGVHQPHPVDITVDVLARLPTNATTRDQLGDFLGQPRRDDFDDRTRLDQAAHASSRDRSTTDDEASTIGDIEEKWVRRLAHGVSTKSPRVRKSRRSIGEKMSSSMPTPTMRIKMMAARTRLMSDVSRPT